MTVELSADEQLTPLLLALHVNKNDYGGNERAAETTCFFLLRSQ
jgi:hypothetical protein